MITLPNRRHILAVSAAFLVTGCATMAPPSPTIPVVVDAAPFGEHVPLGYLPVFMETSDDERFTAIYLAWDWNSGTRPEGPTSLVLLTDRQTGENYELPDFRNEHVNALNWQATDMMRLRTSEGRVYVQLDQGVSVGTPPEAFRTEPPSDAAKRRAWYVTDGTPNMSFQP